MKKIVIEVTDVELRHWRDIGHEIVKAEGDYRNMSGPLAIREIVRRVSRMMKDDPDKHSPADVAFDLMDYTK